MDTPLVSIIIPVYNSGDYLHCCLESVIAQDYREIEIILVDDGSTDLSGNICDEYAKKDARILVLHQENRGQADARNKALAISKGEYIAYVDSDDYIGADYIKELVKTLLEFNADIVQGRVVKYRENTNLEHIHVKNENCQIYAAADALEEFCYQRKFDPGPCSKLIKRGIIEGIPFPVDVGYEDMAIMYRVYGTATKLVYNPNIVYFYRQHAVSTMHAQFSDKKIDRIRIAEKMRDYIEECYPKNKRAVKTRFLLANMQLLMELPFRREYKKLLEEIKKNIADVRRDVLCDRKSKKSIRIMAAMSYFGMPVLYCLGKCYKIVVVGKDGR